MAKHPVPKKKTSKARGSRRYKAFRNKARVRLENAIHVVSCAKCKAKIKAHTVCPECGYYRGNDLTGKKAEEKITTIKAD